MIHLMQNPSSFTPNYFQPLIFQLLNLLIPTSIFPTSDVHLTSKLLLLTAPSAFSRRAVVSYWRKYVHEVLVNRLGGLSLPRKSVVRLTDSPDMTLDVYRGRKTTIQPTNQLLTAYSQLLMSDANLCFLSLDLQLLTSISSLPTSYFPFLSSYSLLR